MGVLEIEMKIDINLDGGVLFALILPPVDPRSYQNRPLLFSDWMS